jgi:hypothetical protein
VARIPAGSDFFKSLVSATGPAANGSTFAGGKKECIGGPS